MNKDYLKEFEELNETTESVFNLGETGLLIIMKDGTNLTDWDDVDDHDDVLYVSEDLSMVNGSSDYRYCDNAEIMILQNYKNPAQLGKLSIMDAFNNISSLKALYLINWDTSGETSMMNMFLKCYSLEYIYGLQSWDTSNVENFWGTFSNCCSLKTLDGLENWDLSSAVKMESMFESCFMLEDISPLSNWDMSNTENIFEIFRDCYSLEDASCLNWKFENLKNGDDLFIHCPNLKKLPKWYDREFIYRFGIRKEVENMDDKTIYDKVCNDEFNEQDLFVAISYIEDEGILKKLVNDSSLHFYAKRAVLLNPNFRDTETLEFSALNCYDHIERAFAIENPNFKNIRILKRIANDDENYLVRFKAERKLKKMLYDAYGA
jgi:surface protein